MIVSRQNNLIKHLKALSSKKERSLFKSYLVEGEKSVADAIRLKADIAVILATPDKADLFEGKGYKVEQAEKSVVDCCCDAVTPQGVVAEVAIPPETDEIVGNCVLLDGVSDPGNVGTVIRTCAAVGVKDVILVGCCDAYSPKCVRASMSGIFSVNVHETTAEKALSLVKDKTILTADMGGENVFDTVCDDFCLIIGNEAHGVSELFKSSANKIVAIPMRAEMESLNAGVSCSIILYQLLKNKI